jgi:hypothetical protein
MTQATDLVLGLTPSTSSFSPQSPDSLIRELGRRILPDHPPDYRVVPPVRIPSPPLLPDPSEGPAEDAVLIDAAYCFVHGSNRKTPMTPVKMRQRRDFGQHVYAAEVFRLRKIPPVAWFRYSSSVCGSWAQEERPFQQRSWALSKKHLERVGWFREWYESDASDFLKPAPKHVLLWGRYNELMRRLECSVDPTWCDGRSVIASLWDLYFPGDTYERMVLAACAESLRLQREMDDAAARGVLVWWPWI